MSIAKKFFSDNRFIIKRKYLTIGNRFYICDKSGRIIFYGLRDPYKIRSDFHIFTTDSDKAYITIKDNSLRDYNTKYKIFVGKDHIGSIKKDVKKFGLRHKWLIYNKDNIVIGIAEEISWVKALFRRFMNIPLLSIILKADVVITLVEGNLVAKITRLISFFDKYLLEFEKNNRLDRRYLIALSAILMDTTSGR